MHTPRLLRVVAVSVLAAGCGGDKIAGPPPTPVPTQLSVSTQPSASAPNAAPLPAQPAVRLRDANGIAVAKAGVVVTVTASGSAAVTNGTATTNANGIATFAGLTLTGTVGSYTLTFSAASLTAAQSNPIALVAGAPAAVVLTTQPSAASQAGVALAQQPVVQLRDVSGNDATTAAVTVTASVVSGTVTVGNATALTTASGSATFAGLTLSGAVGSYTLRFAATGLTPADAAAATVLAAGPATQLALATTPPAGATNGAVFPSQTVVQLRDAFGNNATQAGVVVVASVVSGPAGSAIAGDSATTNAAGAATFNALKLTGLVGSYGVRFASTGLASVVGTTALAAGAAKKLGITTAPSSGPQSGIAFATQPVIQVQDTSGNAVAQAGTVVHATVTGASLANDSATTDAAGKATFSGLTMSGTAAIYQLAFTAPGLSAATSAPIGLGAGTAMQLSLATQPALTAVDGVALTRQPVVRLLDGAGNVSGQAGVVVTATVVSGTVTIGTATATTNGSGTATFTALTLTGTVGSYTLRFSATGMTSVDAAAPTVLSVGAASQLTLTTQPAANATVGVALSTQPVVQLRDVGGNAVSQSGVLITAAAAGVTLTNNTATTNAAGQATFAGLTLSGVSGAGYQLSFGATGVSSVNATLATALSPGAPAAMQLLVAPPFSAVNDVPFSVTPQILVQDAAGNALANQAVKAEAPGATVINGTATTNASGIASFPSLVLRGQVSGYSIRFCTGTDCNTALALVVAPTPTALGVGGAAAIIVTAQPSPAAMVGVALAAQPAVHVTDIGGNAVAGATIVASAGAATVSGGSVLTDAAGDAVFSSLTLSGTAGNYTLQFSTTGASAGATAATSLAAGAAALLTINTQPSAAATNGTVLAQQPVVTVTDIAGNPVAGATVTVTTTAGVTVSNDSAITDGAGVATFVGLALTGTANPYVLTFTSGAATANANTLTLGVGAALTVTIATPPPAAAVNGAVFTTVPVIHVTDGVNPVPGVVVRASVVGATLGNATASTNASGDATFSGLTMSGPAPASYTLVFTAGSAAPVSPPAMNLSVGPGTRLAMVTQPSTSVQNAAALAVQPAVRITDAGGNAVAQQNITVTASVVSGAAVVGSATALTNAGGVATFSSLKLTGPVGSYTLRFSGPALTAVNASAATAVTVGAPARLAVVSQPSFSSLVGQVLAQQPVVQIQDVSGNAVAQAGVTVTATTDSLPGTLQGTLGRSTGAGGSAAFTDLLVATTAGHRLFQFTAAGLTMAVAADTTVVAALVTSGTPVANSGFVNSERPYAITVPPGADSLVVTISDPTFTQTADLYVRYGAAPEPFGGPSGTGLYDCFPSNSGANETCKMVLPAAGTWYVLVRAFPFGYSNVTLTARVY